jgi:hypothetical protein
VCPCRPPLVLSYVPLCVPSFLLYFPHCVHLYVLPYMPPCIPLCTPFCMLPYALLCVRTTTCGTKTPGTHA